MAKNSQRSSARSANRFGSSPCGLATDIATLYVPAVPTYCTYLRKVAPRGSSEQFGRRGHNHYWFRRPVRSSVKCMDSSSIATARKETLFKVDASKFNYTNLSSRS